MTFDVASLDVRKQTTCAVKRLLICAARGHNATILQARHQYCFSHATEVCMGGELTANKSTSFLLSSYPLKGVARLQKSHRQLLRTTVQVYQSYSLNVPHFRTIPHHPVLDVGNQKPRKTLHDRSDK